jgi:hypothetical protein
MPKSINNNFINLQSQINETDFLFDTLKMQNQNTEYLNSIGFSVYDNKGNIELSSNNIGRSKRKRVKYVVCPFCEEKQLNNVEFCRYCGEFLEPYND